VPKLLLKALANRLVFLLLLFAVLGVGIFLGWYYIKTGSTVGWKTSQFFFSYQELGFVKRGLVGTLIHPFPILLTPAGVVTLSCLFLAAFALGFWKFFVDSCGAFGEAERATLAAVCLLAPSMFLRLGFDYGRYDPLTLLLTVLAAAALVKSRDVIAALCCAAAMLIHEGFLVIGFPILCAVILSREEASASARWRRLMRFAALPIAVTAGVVLFGRYEPGIDVLTQHFKADARYVATVERGEVNVDALIVLTRSAKETFYYSLAFFAERKPFGHLALIGAWFYFFCRFYDGFFRRNALKRDWLYFAAFSPLLLSVTACDYFRWVALASANMLFVVLLKARELHRHGRRAVVVCDLGAIVVMASCLLGPISNTKSFPYLFLLLEKISPWPIAW